MYYDLHTHHFPEGNGDICAIRSVGIHPWYISKDNIEEKLGLIEKYALSPQVQAIGECGLDKLCETDFELQKEVFLSHISISEKTGKPLIIHCVKAFDEIILFKKESRPTQTWIIHGFRGKPQQAKQLIEQGFYLSFGLHYNEQSLQNIPIERVFFETDDSGCDIRTIYKNAASVLNISEEKLIRQIEKNISIFLQNFC
jgi:TatD DNase family protein